MSAPSLRAKLAFWLLLGLFSTALAEVVSGSAPFVLFTPWGLLVTLPVYLLHAVFLAGVVYRFAGSLSLESLYLAGALFGLYEAYLTKVLWSPTWEPIPVRLGGVHVFETVLLVLFWHPLLAFVVPLVIVETLATRSRLVVSGMSRGIRTRLSGRPGRAAALGGLLLGLFQGSVVPDPATALGSAVATSIVLVAALYAWRRRVGADRYELGELLPRGRQLGAFGVLLAAMYVVYGGGLRPEHLPGLAAQATVWVLYSFFGALLALQLRRDRLFAAPAAPGRVVPLSALARYVAIYVAAVGVAIPLLRPVAPATYVALYFAAIAVGGSTLVWIVRGLRRPWTGSAPGSRARGGLR